ncbi:Nin1 binding protein [Puccinia graminis f. sp. tritici]|uniref:20S-pre-rRNA D-site endonuclease NOB1 n=1 Tax=Puccinia graminis f. sp. tritici TaxID=56615 RepID=A0A5B0M2D2_PUCGR|nr:Nin1 binding protein [Puccinia graminis f. sp. tritici]
MPSQDRTQTLVLDTAPLLTSSLSSLLLFSNRFVTTQDVIEEVRGKGQRERLEQEWKILDATLNNSAAQTGDEWTGLQIREPSTAGISKIKEFATKTGDIAVLSSADIRVLALAYDVEVEANGTWRLRDTLGAKRMGKDPEKKKARQLRKLQQQQQQQQQQDQSSLEKPAEESNSPTDHPVLCNGDPPKPTSAELDSTSSQAGAEDVEQLVEHTDQLTLETAVNHPESSVSGAEEESDERREAPNQPVTSHSEITRADSVETASDIDWVKVPIKIGAKASEEESDISSFVSASDPSWITPENVHIHQAKDMGFFPSLGNKPVAPKLETIQQDSASLADQEHQHNNDQHSDINTPITNSTVGEGSSKPPTMKAAVLTGDYAMQNVALQIGLNVLGVGGKRIRDVKTWVLRCYGCFKLCKDPTRKFCPTCGGATLTRVSITYTPSSPTGYILHLNPNFQYRNRGTVYSIPSAKPGSSSFEKGGAKQKKSINGAHLVLREDQKEFQRGLKSVKIQKEKEERKLKNIEGSHAHALTSLSGWNDPDWEPAMLLGEKGRKSSGRGNHHNHSVRYGKDGLPLIGFGKNPNEVRRCSKR